MPQHDSGICPVAMPGSNANAMRLADARTYVRTNAELLTLASYPSLGNARAGGVRRNPAEWSGIRRRRASAAVQGGGE